MKQDALAGGTVKHPVSFQNIIKMLRRNTHKTSLANAVGNTDHSFSIPSRTQHVILSQDGRINIFCHGFPLFNKFVFFPFY